MLLDPSPSPPLTPCLTTAPLPPCLMTPRQVVMVPNSKLGHPLYDASSGAATATVSGAATATAGSHSHHASSPTSAPAVSAPPPPAPAEASAPMFEFHMDALGLALHVLDTSAPPPPPPSMARAASKLQLEGAGCGPLHARASSAASLSDVAARGGGPARASFTGGSSGLHRRQASTSTPARPGVAEAAMGGGQAGSAEGCGLARRLVLNLDASALFRWVTGVSPIQVNDLVKSINKSTNVNGHCHACMCVRVCACMCNASGHCDACMCVCVCACVCAIVHAYAHRSLVSCSVCELSCCPPPSM